MASKDERRVLSAALVNPTSYFALRHRPLALCIETKKPGEGWEAATLQLSVWHAAQWKILEPALDDEVDRQSLSDISVESEPTQLGSRLNLDSRQVIHAVEQELRNCDDEERNERLHLEFLPGIIIQGHDWYLAITTRDGRQTVFWNKLTIGTTSSVIGIYQIVCALQILRQWCEEDYWPLVRERLGLD